MVEEFRFFAYLSIASINLPYPSTTATAMETHDLLIIIHLIGFATLFTTGVAGWILNRQYGSAPDFQAKGVILRAGRPIGLMSPVAILMMLVTGIGNMHLLGLGVFTESWLSLKLLFFLIAAIIGITFGIKAKARGKLVMGLARGETGEDATRRLSVLDKQFNVFYLVQLTFLLLILILSVVKPGRYGL